MIDKITPKGRWIDKGWDYNFLSYGIRILHYSLVQAIRTCSVPDHVEPWLIMEPYKEHHITSFLVKEPSTFLVQHALTYSLE